MVNTAADVRTLVVTPDGELAAKFVDVGQELGIACEIAATHDGVPEELQHEKYEGLAVDFDSIAQADRILSALRENPSNRQAVVFAFATDDLARQQALNHGANFVLERPLDARCLRRTLYAAYEAMTRERRRYFRCAAELPVFLTRADGNDLAARTGNISANGMSIVSSTHFSLGERLGITLDLQTGGPDILARGLVVWDDKHGKSGISFECVRPELQELLDGWLDQQFKKIRVEALRELQKARALSRVSH